MEAQTKSKLILQPDFDHQYYIVKNLITEREIRKELESLAVSDDQDIDPQEAGLLVDLETTLQDLLKRSERFSKSYKMTLELKGEIESGRVWLFGKEITAEESLKYRNHSPTGFSYGYGGSGPAQLALALCIEIMGVEKGLNVYQDFKWKYIATLPQGDFEMDVWIEVD